MEKKCQKNTNVHLLLSKYPHYLILSLLLYCIDAPYYSPVISLLALLLFFRSPDRELPRGTTTSLCSPADGNVVSISSDEHYYRIAIFLTVMDVHVQYSPCDGTVVSQRYKKGEFHPAYLLEKSQYNERMETDIVTNSGDLITVIQIAGQIANRIESFVQKGTSVSHGCRLGIIKFGSRVDLIVPKASYVLSEKIVIGKHLTAGETLLFHKK